MLDDLVCHEVSAIADMKGDYGLMCTCGKWVRIEPGVLATRLEQERKLVREAKGKSRKVSGPTGPRKPSRKDGGDKPSDTT